MHKVELIYFKACQSSFLLERTIDAVIIVFYNCIPSDLMQLAISNPTEGCSFPCLMMVCTYCFSAEKIRCDTLHICCCTYHLLLTTTLILKTGFYDRV